MDLKHLGLPKESAPPLERQALAALAMAVFFIALCFLPKILSCV
ncbi:MAG: hypothetical protein WBC07_08390 [Methylotenera sp.]